MNVNELKKKSNRRVDTGYLRNLGIQSYGDDNLYPQHLRNIIAASSTGSECAERYANFIEGNGFREVAFSEYVVNRRGDTADDIHAFVCKDVADYDGMAIHVNYSTSPLKIAVCWRRMNPDISQKSQFIRIGQERKPVREKP